MRTTKILLIGPINMGQIPCTGDTMKNQLFLKRFNEVFDKVISVDTYHWQKRPWCILIMIIKLIFNPRAKIVLSMNPGSANSVIGLLNTLNLSHRTFYWVVGGSFHNMIDSGRYLANRYSKLAKIIVQGQSMVESLQKHGLNNVIFVPNSKQICFLPVKRPIIDNKLHFVFLSRIEREKGCDYIIKAADILEKSGYKDRFDITFYGKTTTDLSYRDIFKMQITKKDNLFYKGVLDLTIPENYKELAKYDVMLFPTYWDGEGFPGVIIDAYISGLPIIATDWNLNRDVVIEGKTGWIIPPHDISALTKAMMYVIDNPHCITTFSTNNQNIAKKFDYRNVLSVENLINIGVL